MNVYVLDGIIASIVLLGTLSTILISSYDIINVYSNPEKELSELLSEPFFVSSLYSKDEKTVEAYLNSFISKPYNLTVFYPDGRVYLSIGCNVQGLSAVARLPGWNGSLNTLIVCLRVGG